MIRIHSHRPEQLRLDLPVPRASARPRAAASPTRHQVVGLFAGIGGIERGLERAGHSTTLLCEYDAAASAVLRARFPGVPIHPDVRTLKGLPSGTSLLTAGFPCQDLSQAGRTAGIEGARSGLVGEVFRVLRSHEVPWVLLENVPFMLQLSRGRAMEVITAALEDLGYRWAYRIVDTRAFGLPQRRRRVYLVASLIGDPRDVLFADEADPPPEPPHTVGEVAVGFYWTEGLRGLGWAPDAVPTLKGGSTIGIPSAPAILRRDGGLMLPDVRDAERLQGFPVDWTRPAEAVTRPGGRWKLVGNAVSVPAAVWLGRRLARPGDHALRPTAPLRTGAAWPNAASSTEGGRMSVSATEHPVAAPRPALEDFLRYPGKPLSLKATTGFLRRARAGSLRFPQGFLAAVQAHLERMQRGVPA